MDDLNFEALILVLENQSELLDQDPVTQANLDTAIKDLQTKYDSAKTKKEKAEIYGQVKAVAKGLEGVTAASISLSKAVKSGDPFAISAQSLALAGSVVAILSAAGGPPGAAIGAIVGAVLAIVSMILGLFQKESESLINQLKKWFGKSTPKKNWNPCVQQKIT
jgi:hypothetical protein